MVEEPKPLKKQAQIKQDEACARELEAELNKNIDWDKVIDHVQRKEKEDNDVKRHQALKRKPQTKAQAKKNMMIYLRNMAGFKMDYFKGMTYDDIRPVFEKKFNSNVAFLQKTKEKMEEEDSRALKRLTESQEDKAVKKQKLDEEVNKMIENITVYNGEGAQFHKTRKAVWSPLSGTGYEDYYARELLDYVAEHGMPFTLLHFWEVLKEYGDASINLNVDVGDDRENEVQELRRPIGRDKSKGLKKKGPRSSGSPSSTNDEA
nr:hypothetical protein [Tanacetum cinerariifolium]